MKSTLTKIVAIGCVVLFQNNFGSKYEPPILIEAKPYIDDYIVPEPEVDIPVVIHKWHFPLPEVPKTNSYIEQYRGIARRCQVPMSIKLAQGYLESNEGKSTLATQANNHFGLKCQSRHCKPGHCINKQDDSHKDFFIKFKTVEDSYRYHDDRILKNPRYKYLTEIPCTDMPIRAVYRPNLFYKFSNELRHKTVYWKGQPMKPGATYTMTGKAWWCVYLCAAGYATDEHYADKLYKIILEYDL